MICVTEAQQAGQYAGAVAPVAGGGRSPARRGEALTGIWQRRLGEAAREVSDMPLLFIIWTGCLCQGM